MTDGGRAMTATDELRKMLDERGVTWGNVRRDGAESDYYTEWCFGDNGTGLAAATEWAVGRDLDVCMRMSMTPAKAIDATLGRGTCEIVVDNRHRVDEVTTSWGCVCSACGGFHQYTHGDRWAFCPSCGAKVVEE